MCRKIKLVSLCAFSVAFAVTGAAIASSDDSTNAANAPNATNGVTVRLSFPAGAGCVLPARDVTFSPASEQVSPDEVGVALWTSYLAYTPSFYAVHTAKTAGFTQSEFVDEGWGKKDPTGFQALVASRAGVRIVSVRGSSEMSDWSSNSNDTTRPVWSLGIEGWIHRGYADQVESAVSNVKRALDRGNDEAPVIVTGHSLGGAVASVLATKLAKDGYPIGRLVTFAAPRAGDETFARAAKKALEKEPSAWCARMITSRAFRQPPPTRSLVRGSSSPRALRLWSPSTRRNSVRRSTITSAVTSLLMERPGRFQKRLRLPTRTTRPSLAHNSPHCAKPSRRDP